MADSIKIGNLDISAFKVGAADCSIYLGDVKLYPNEEPTPSYPYTFYRVSRDGSGYTVECSASSADTITSAQTKSGVTASELSSTTATQTPMEVVFGDCCQTIGSGACSGWSQVTSITISDSVNTIRSNAFRGCSGITSINIPSSVTIIESSAFNRCGALTSVTFNEGLTDIGPYAFSGCSNLASIDIPNSVTRIENNAFQTCSGMTSVNVGSGVTAIDADAFWNCTSLTSMTFHSITPPHLYNSGVLSQTNNCPIYVPTESVETYKAASVWSDFASRIQAIQT